MTALIITIFIFQFLICLAAVGYCAYLLGAANMQKVFIKNQHRTQKRLEFEINKLQETLILWQDVFVKRTGGTGLVQREPKNTEQKPTSRIISPSEAINREKNKEVEQVNPQVKSALLPSKEQFLADVNKISS